MAKSRRVRLHGGEVGCSTVLLLAVLWALMCGASLWAADPAPTPAPRDPGLQRTITVPITITVDVAPLDAPAELDLAEDAAVTATAQFAADDYAWQVLPARKSCLSADRKTLWFAGGTKHPSYQVICAGSQGGKVIGPYVATVVLKTDTPPEPPEPPAPAGIQAAAATAARAVTGDTAQAEAALLAKLYRQIAGRAEITSLDDLIKATRYAREMALDSARVTAWDPFATAVGQVLEAERTAGRLTTIDQGRTAWLQIAAGLETAWQSKRRK